MYHPPGPTRFLFPILLADPLDSPLLYIPQVGVRGRCIAEAGPGRSSMTNRQDALGRLPCGEGFE